MANWVIASGGGSEGWQGWREGGMACMATVQYDSTERLFEKCHTAVRPDWCMSAKMLGTDAGWGGGNTGQAFHSQMFGGVSNSNNTSRGVTQ